MHGTPVVAKTPPRGHYFYRPRMVGAVPEDSRERARLIAQAVDQGRVKRCPTKFVAPSPQAMHDKAAPTERNNYVPISATNQTITMFSVYYNGGTMDELAAVGVVSKTHLYTLLRRFDMPTRRLFLRNKNTRYRVFARLKEIEDANHDRTR